MYSERDYCGDFYYQTDQRLTRMEPQARADIQRLFGVVGGMLAGGSGSAPAGGGGGGVAGGAIGCLTECEATGPTSMWRPTLGSPNSTDGSSPKSTRTAAERLVGEKAIATKVT